jgi:hypothetical protein
MLQIKNYINGLSAKNYNFAFTLFFLSIVLILSSQWAKYGADLSDTGFFLYIQNRLSNRQLDDIGPNFFWIGSDLLGTIWLKIIGTPSLYLARLGAYLLCGINFIINHFSIINILKDRFLAIKISLITYLIFAASSIFPIINYDLAPLLPLTILIFIITRIIFKNKTYKIDNIIIGALLFILVLMRLPLALFVILSIPIFYKINRKKLFIFLFQITIGSLIVLSFLLSFEIFREPIILFFKTISQLFYNLFIIKNNENSSLSLLTSKNYKISDQIYFWLRGYFRIIVFTTLIILCSIFIKKSKTQKLRNIFYWITTIFLTIFTILPLSKIYILNKFEISAIQDQLIYNYIISGLVIYIIFYLIKSNNKKVNLFSFLVLIIFILFPVGSNSFEKKLSLTYSMIIPICLSLVILQKKKLQENFGIKYKILLLSTKLLLIPLSFMAVKKLITFPYRDESAFNLDFKTQISGMQGVYTTKEKAHEIDFINSWVSENKTKDSRLLCLGQISIFNYVNNIEGIFDYPWPTYLNIIYFKKILYESNKFNKLDMIIIPKHDVTTNKWDINSNSNIDISYLNCINEYMNNNSFTLVKETSFFKIYSVLKK